MDEYKVNIEDGEITTVEKGDCGSLSLTACDSSNFNPSPESWFNFDSTTGTITGFSDSWDGTTDITIPCQIGGVDVVNIGDDNNTSAFASKDLTSVVINDNIKSIGHTAFVSNKIENLVLGNSVESIGYVAFQFNKLETLEIPESIKEIGDNAFYENQLTKLTIGNNTTSIGTNAFYNNKIKNLNLGTSLQSIGAQAFAMNQLETIEIPSSVTTIGGYAFVKGTGSNPNLTTVINKSKIEFDWATIFAGTYDNQNNVVIPVESILEKITIINEF